MELSSELVVVIDRRGNVRYVNDSARRLGYDPAAVVGMPAVEMLHPDDAVAGTQALLRSAADPANRDPIEVRVRAADGGFRVYEAIATNLLDDPAVNGMVLNCRDVTDRHEQERRFRLLFEQSPLPQALVRPDDLGIIGNDALGRLFGYSRDELLLLRSSELLTEEARTEAAIAAVEFEDGDRSTPRSTRLFRRRSGELFHGRTATSALRDEDGRLEFILVAIEDVSESVAAEAALAESEARLKAIVNNSTDIILVIRPDGEWEATDHATRLLGYPKGHAPEGGIPSLVHPDDLAAAAAALQEIIAGTHDHESPVELRLRAADGDYWDFECVGQNLAEEFEVGGVVVTARNVTARKRAERARGRDEARFKTAFERAPMGVSLVDLQGRLLDVNAAACTMVGRTREEMLQLDPTAVLHPEDVELALDLTVRQLAGEEIEGEFRLLRSDGTVVWVLSNATLYEPEDGSDPYVITMQIDVTERKQLEARLTWEATRDQLTGLLNRGAFMTHLELALSRQSSDLALLFIDLDHFKPVNDTLGHEAGDAVLVAIADRIAAVTRGGDVAARLGGDEFVVAYHGREGVRNLRVAAERVCAAVAEPLTIRDQTVSVGASVGAAVAGNDDIAADLMHRADEAAYAAKQAGGSRVVIADGKPLARLATTPRL